MTTFADLTTLRVGGPAVNLVRSRRREELIGNFMGADPASTFLLSGGSNVVVSDEGWPGTTLLIQGGATGRRIVEGGAAVEFTVDAGVTWDDLVASSVEAGATGIELLSGIPGSVGAAPVQNVAAYGQQVCDAIVAVGTFDRTTFTVAELDAEACGFGYRTSNFKTVWRGTKVITHVVLRLPLASATPPAPSTYGDLVRWFAANGGDPGDVATRRRAVLAVRAAKSMVLADTDPMSRSAGSFFMNPVVPAGDADTLIERFTSQGLDVQYLEGQRKAAPDATTRRVPAALVLRAAGFNPGDRWGPVQLSDKHVLAIVTHDGATADDVWQLSHLVRQRVVAETVIVKLVGGNDLAGHRGRSGVAAQLTRGNDLRIAPPPKMSGLTTTSYEPHAAGARRASNKACTAFRALT